MLVCRHLLNVIRPMALPDTVHITRENSIPRLGQVLDTQRSNKAQITDLVIDSVDLNEELVDAYQKCLPKVRSLYLRY